MLIDNSVCIGCESCIVYCPMGAIISGPTGVAIEREACVECNICRHADVCPTDALVAEEHEWPRAVRRVFSDPLATHASTNVPGRGTEEMKTNEVTGRIRHGWAGVAVELGRPGTGTTFRDVEKVAMAVAKHRIIFERQNPVCGLMTDETGKIRDDILEEKVLSAIVEFVAPLEAVADVLQTIRDVSEEIDTVFSVDLACRVSPEGEIPAVAVASAAGMTVSINGKVNVGLGRPRAGEDAP